MYDKMTSISSNLIDKTKFHNSLQRIYKATQISLWTQELQQNKISKRNCESVATQSLTVYSNQRLSIQQRITFRVVFHADEAV